MSSSNSFDSTANLNQSFRYKMSAEANRLFQTLQESPLPIEVCTIGPAYYMVNSHHARNVNYIFYLKTTSMVTLLL